MNMNSDTRDNFSLAQKHALVTDGDNGGGNGFATLRNFAKVDAGVTLPGPRMKVLAKMKTVNKHEHRHAR